MVKTIVSLLFLLLAYMPAGNTAESAKNPAAESEQAFDLVNPPHPTTNPGKIEVIEFFWYGCPHCYHFEPHIKAWLKNKPEYVVFIRQPAVFNARWAAHAKAFFTAESLGVLDKVHDDLYDAIQNKREPMESEADQAKFFVAHGVKEDDFHKAYKSFAVDAKMRQAEALAPSYGIDGTPALVVNGKYRIGAAKAKSYEKMIATANELVKQEAAANHLK